jgi:hypothetical protein
MHSNQHLLGQSTSKGICSSSTTSDALFASTATSGTRYIRIENLYISDSVIGTRTAGAGIHIDGNGSAAIFDLKDVQITGFYDGVNATTSITSSVDNVRSTLAVRDGFHWQLTSTSTSFRNTYADTPGRYGYYATILNYSTFDGTACDSPASDAYHLESGDGGYSRGVTFHSPGAEFVGANGMYLDGVGFVINGGAFSGMPIGTGMAGIKLNGASNTTIISPYISGGDYAVNLAAAPAHTAAIRDHSVVIDNVYGISQGVGLYHDPNNLLAIAMTQVVPPSSSGQICRVNTFAIDTGFHYACVAGTWYRNAVSAY